MNEQHEALPPRLANLLRLNSAQGPATALSDERAAMLTTQVLQAALDGAEIGGSRGRARRLAAPAAIGVLALGIGSAAAFYIAGPGWLTRQPNPPSETHPAEASGGVPAQVPGRQPPPQPPPARGEQVPDVEPSGADLDVDRSARLPRQQARRGAGQQDLLERANRLRGEGRYRAAERTYLRVVRGAPGSPAAYVATVAAADLRRERLGDPRGALTLYRQALTAPGPLSVEAHRGIAKSQRALGHLDAERRALRALLAAQPDGPAAQWARRRLEETGVR